MGLTKVLLIFSIIHMIFNFLGAPFEPDEKLTPQPVIEPTEERTGKTGGAHSIIRNVVSKQQRPSTSISRR